MTSIIPSPEEIETIIETAEPLLKAALVVIIKTGMRIGRLYSLTMKSDGTMVTTTKGTLHIHPEKASEQILRAIKEANLDARHPFGNVALTKRVETLMTDEERFTAAMNTSLAQHIAKLEADGKIRARYSFHDFRHAYADQHAEKGLM